MKNNNKLYSFLSDNWLLLLIAVQPVLDVVAYWTRSPEGTVSGYIRLCILVALPLYLLVRLKNKKTFIVSMLVIGAFCALHVLNGFRVGNYDIAGDVAYMLKVVQGPVLAICFMFYIRDERMRGQAEKGILLAAGISVAFLAIACLTNTANSTYAVGQGISGWVIADNRCANSIILVSLFTFAAGFAARSDKKALNIVIPIIIAVIFIANGTKACYVSLFGIFLGFSAFTVVNRFVNKKKINLVVVITLLALSVMAVVIYPYTPRAKVSAEQAKAGGTDQIKIELSALGYDLDAMTTQEKMDDPVVRGVYEQWYRKYIYYVIPDMIDRFGMDAVFLKYDMTYSAKTLIDTRLMKSNYASMIWSEVDTLTKLVGFDYQQIGNGGYDLENDWPALFYYYGYVGVGLYGLFVLYFIILIIKRLLADFKGSFEIFNFTLMLCLMLQLGLSQLSGALLRQPHSSIYFSVVLALIYYKTTHVLPAESAIRS